MLNQIRYFQTVVRCGSFTEAAEECHISQSAISQQIKALEQELGVELLQRQNRSFVLTPAGELFQKRSAVLLADYDRLVQDTIRLARRDRAELRIGYLKSYAGQALQSAVAHFSEKYPDVAVHLLGGSHEDLYEALRTERVDLALSDQRRAFSDEYVNLSLANVDCFVEMAGRNELAGKGSVTPAELKSCPCVLIASKGQQKTEQVYYRDVIGFQGEFLFAESLDEARLTVLQHNGFTPVDRGQTPGSGTKSIPLVRNGRPVTRHYCAFWKQDNSGYYIEEFAQMLKESF